MKEKQDVTLLGKISLILSAPAMKLAPVMLLLIAAVTGWLVPKAINIQNDDDVIKFLPQDDEKIVKFKDVGDKFHGLQMAIVGVKAEESIFTLEDITLVRRYAQEFKTLQCHKVDENGDWIPLLDDNGAAVVDENGQAQYVMTPCVSNTTCFTEIQDIGHSRNEAGEELASVTDLVPEFPAPGSEEAVAKADEIKARLAKVQEHVRTLDHVNGFLVSDDGRAAAVYAQVDDVNVSTKEAADIIRERVISIHDEMNSKAEIFYGGSPFIGMYSADQSRADMAALTPFVILIVTLIILLTSRSIFATLIALFSVGVSVVWVMGGMELLGMKLTLISTSLPILLMALGSAYSIHLINAMLTRLDEGMPRKEAMREALIHTGPPIIVCVATTAFGFFSFLAMDVDPMVEYGAAMGVSTIVIMLVTFWVVTSAVVLLPIKPQKGGRAPAWAINAMKKGADGIYNHGKLSAVIVGLIVVAACFFASNVKPHGDNSSLFAEGSLPIRADDFMNDNFGGANFIQTEINADVSSPLVLRQVERMTAYIKSHERIAGIQSISDVVNLVGGSMGDGQHITDNYLQAKNLTALAFSNDASVAMELSMCSCETPAKNGVCLPECVSPKDGSCLTKCTSDMNWRHSLMQIRVAGKDLEEGASLADEFQVQMEPIFAPRMAIPRDKMTPAAIETEKAEMRDHLKWIYKAYEHRNDPKTGKPFVTEPLTDDVIDQAIFSTTVEPTLEDIRQALDIHLFSDPENAIIVLAFDIEESTVKKLIEEAVSEGEKGIVRLDPNLKGVDEITAKVMADIEDGKFSETSLTNAIAENALACCGDETTPKFKALYDSIVASKADIDIMAKKIFEAIQNKTYNETFLYDVVNGVISEEEDDDVFVRQGVTFLNKQILNVRVEKNRLARAEKLFAMTNVKPSEKLDELVKSAIWSLDDENVFLPRDKFVDLQPYFVEFHSPEIAKDIDGALSAASSADKAAVADILSEKLFDNARVYYFDNAKLNREALATSIADAKANGSYSLAWLTDELHKAMKIGEEIEVIPSGYPIIYRAMNASVVHNQIVSVVYSFIMVIICLILFTMSMRTGFLSVIPAVITVLVTFGIMGVFGLGLDAGSSMIAAISLSVGIDYACHLVWKFGRPEKTPEALKAASDHMLESTGWGIVINALEIGLGLSVLYFGDLLPMRNFGVLTGVAMIVSGAASLLLLSGLMRWARKHSSRSDVRLGEGMDDKAEATEQKQPEELKEAT